MAAQRIAIVGNLRLDAVETTEEVIAKGPPFELDAGTLKLAHERSFGPPAPA